MVPRLPSCLGTAVGAHSAVQPGIRAPCSPSWGGGKGGQAGADGALLVSVHWDASEAAEISY